MIKKKVVKLLCEQVTNELYAGHLYLSMSMQAEDMNLPGLANWLYVQHQEEHSHAMYLAKYLNDLGVKIELGALQQPEVTWENPLDIAKGTLAHEKLITQMFYKIMDVATQEKDYASMSFLSWFIDEQVEEEDSTTQLVDDFTRVEGNKGALIFLDSKLAARVFASDIPNQTNK